MSPQYHSFDASLPLGSNAPSLCLPFELRSLADTVINIITISFHQ